MYQIVTIERQYASGGNEIGRKLAEALGYKLYDRNILMEAAKNLKIPSVQIEGLEERSPGGFLQPFQNSFRRGFQQQGIIVGG